MVNVEEQYSDFRENSKFISQSHDDSVFILCSFYAFVILLIGLSGEAR